MIYTRAKALEPIIYGRLVKVADDRVSLAGEADMTGVVVRHRGSGSRKHYNKGELALIQTEGWRRAVVDGWRGWVDLRKGKICRAR